MFPAQMLYKSRLFVAGVTLMLLGLGNYVAAITKVPHYQELVSELGAQIPQAQPFLLREAGKPFPSETWERWEIARAKLDYYYVVLSGGRLMMGVGMGCTVLALLSFRRRRTQPALP
jgi:hypothetical protein